MATHVTCWESDTNTASDGERETTISVQVPALACALEKQFQILISEQLSTFEHNFMKACVEVLNPVREFEARSREHIIAQHKDATDSQKSFSESGSMTNRDDRATIINLEPPPSPKRVLVSQAVTPLEDLQKTRPVSHKVSRALTTPVELLEDRRSDEATPSSPNMVVRQKSARIKERLSEKNVIRLSNSNGELNDEGGEDENGKTQRLTLQSRLGNSVRGPSPILGRSSSFHKSRLGREESTAFLEEPLAPLRTPSKHSPALPDGNARLLGPIDDGERDGDKRLVASARFQSRLQSAHNRNNTSLTGVLNKPRDGSSRPRNVVFPVDSQSRDSRDVNGCAGLPTISSVHRMPSEGGPHDRSTESGGSITEKVDFTLLKVWEGEDKPMLKSLKSGIKVGGSQIHLTRMTALLSPTVVKSESEMIERDASSSMCGRNCVLNPNSTIRVFWDLLSTIFIGYEVVATPLQFFELKESTFTRAWAWVSRLFWTIDMPMTLSTGIAKPNGDIDMRRSHILKKYVKTWLIIDIFVVGSDWAEYIMSAGSQATGGAARLTKAFRVMRIVRMVRLLRVGRLPEILERLGEKLPQEITNFIRAAGSVFKTLGLICMLSHTIACIWYGVGDKDNNAWVPYNRMHDEPVEYQYMTALHWSVTQFTGSMEVNPRNTGERVFAVITLLFAFMVATIFVSSLTSSMTQYYIVSSRTTKMVLELRRYLAKNKVSTLLATRLQRNAHFAIRELQQNVQEEEVEVLRYVSEPLRMELHVEVYFPILEEHPFFAKCYSEIPRETRKLCHTSITLIHFSQGDTLFVCGEEPEPPEMLFVRSGTLQYYPGADPQFYEHACSNDVHQGQWLCEAVLWLHWNYMGDLVAVSDGQLMQVNAKRFQDIVSSSPDLLRPKKYAQAFQSLMSQTPIPRLTDIGAHDQVQRVLRTAYGSSFAVHHHHHGHSGVVPNIKHMFTSET